MLFYICILYIIFWYILSIKKYKRNMVILGASSFLLQPF